MATLDHVYRETSEGTALPDLHKAPAGKWWRSGYTCYLQPITRGTDDSELELDVQGDRQTCHLQQEEKALNAKARSNNVKSSHHVGNDKPACENLKKTQMGKCLVFTDGGTAVCKVLDLARLMCRCNEIHINTPRGVSSVATEKPTAHTCTGGAGARRSPGHSEDRAPTAEFTQFPDAQ